MNQLLKKFSFMIVAGLMVALIIGCARKPDTSQVVAEINNFQLTVDDFKYEAGLSLSGASKEQVLQDAIMKELLLQEAQKNNLDKNKRFMKEIENYWKQSLIKRLILMKGEEFLATVKVGADEVKAQYDLMVKDGESRIKPYDQMAAQIRYELRVKKAQILLEQWANQLKASAKIKKYDQVFNSIKIKAATNQDGGTNAE
jgi:hypothetical protein